MKKILICALLALIFFSCKKESNPPCGCVMPYQIYYLKAKVVQTGDIACGKPVLDFTEDSARIRLITDLPDITNYVVTTLPQNLKVADKKLYVSVARLKPEEEFVCNTFGITIPHLKLLDAKPRD